MTLRKLKIALFFLLIGGVANAQFDVTNVDAPQDLVQNTLLGTGVIATNVTYNGSAVDAASIQNNVGYFNGGGTLFPFLEGVVLSTGDVSTIPGAANNFSSTNLGTGPDPDLAAISGVTIYDQCIVEFDFVAQGDSLRFDYIFASEEYPEFSNGTVNDAFGFFISGPGFNGPFTNNAENIALLPDGVTPVSINTVNNGTGNAGPCMNCQYYVHNETNVYGTTAEYDAFTAEFTAEAFLQCGETYHIKLAIADGGDGIYDSGVFLEAGSFQFLPYDLDLGSNVVSISDTVIFEGCGTSADFTFTRPPCLSLDSAYLTIDVSGTSTEGVDFADLPDSILFLPNVSEVTIPFTAIQDGVFEGYESIIISISTLDLLGDTITTSGTLWLFDQPDLGLVAQDTTLVCIGDSIPIYVEPTFGVPPYSFSWEGGPPTTSDSSYADVSQNGITDYIVTVTDFCGFVAEDTLTVNVNQILAIDSLTQNPASACFNDGIAIAYVNPANLTLAPGNQPLYNWDDQANWDNPGSGSNLNGTAWGNISGGWYYFTVTDDVCTVSDSIEVEVQDMPVAQITPSVTSGCAPVEVTFENESQNASTFIWDLGSGTFLANDMNAQSATYNQTTTVMLIAESVPNCSDTAYATINVVTCGCTDPEATNYDPGAAQDDGSCHYPVPEVQAPNIFSPNSDNVNNLFPFTLKNTQKFFYVITNRWGNVMAEKTVNLPTANPLDLTWDGRTPSGANAEEGTYFYKYIATGVDGTEIEGHGFVQLVR